jgi:hypothetical protein
MFSNQTTSRRCCGRALTLTRAAAVAAIGLTGVTPAFAASRPAAPPPRPAAVAETPATVAGVLVPAASRKWSPGLLLFVLGHALPSRFGAPDGRTRWLVHSQHDRRLVVEVAGREVAAALLTVRTTAADAHDIAMASLSALLGPPRRSGPHDARWSSEGVEVRLAGWRGEFNIEVRRR